jgi:cold shock protein
LKINAISDIKPYLAQLIKISIMSNGTVKFYDTTRGFGFIADADSSEEYFVHSTGLNDTIKKDDTVTFELTQGKKGLNAINVKRS